MSEPSASPRYVFKGKAEQGWMIFLSILGLGLTALVSYLNGLDPTQLAKPEILIPAAGMVVGRAVFGGLQAQLPRIIAVFSPTGSTQDPDEIARIISPVLDQLLAQRFGTETPPPLILPADTTIPHPPRHRVS